MTRFFRFPLTPALLTLLLVAAPARAELSVPPEATPPSTTQLQHPPAKQPAPGESTPVALAAAAPAAPTTAAVPAAQQARIEALLRALLTDALVVLLVDAAPAPAAVPEGHAKNLALEPAAPRYTVRLGVSAVQSATFGADYLPVTLTVADAKGQTVATEQLRYREAEEAAFSQAARAFLSKHLPLAASPAEVAAAPDAPRLHAWIESGDGDRVHIGSRIAFYFQASVKGYVSLYHFASSGAVQRLYPTESEPYNFVEAGRIYRYPQSGYLELQGPAGAETVKAILTVLPSNTPRVQAGGLSYKSDPLWVIPTHYPVLFASGDLSRFFALPSHLYTETHIRYTLEPR